MVKMLLVLLLLLLTLLTGVCPRRPREIYVKAGEMVVLLCPHYRGYNNDDAKPIWTRHTAHEMDPARNMSSVDQRRMDVLVHGRSLVFLRASVNHQGNYSCSLGKASRQHWFSLMIYTTQSMGYKSRTTYPKTCFTQESCTLDCPDVNAPAVNTLNITSSGIIWHKEGESSPKTGYFSSVEEDDQGAYTCTRSYLYHGQTYDMTFRVVLDVQPNKKNEKSAVITSPHMNEVFHIDLGSMVVIDCKAVMYSDSDEVFWLTDKSFVDTNYNLPVFYNYTSESNAEAAFVTASLVFKKVSEEDLSKSYTCKLESSSGPSSFISITLAQKASPFSLSLTLAILIIVVVIVVTVLVYLKMKINITLFVRDNLGFYRSTSDGKTYDAFLMYYKSETDAGLREDDRKWLRSVMEDRFGYSLCLYDHDVLPGKAVEEVVMDCIEQSRAVVLVPTSADPGAGTGLLSAIHEALVERQTRLVFIRTEEEAEVLRSGSLPEALQLLSEAGECVTWRGPRSMPPSSAFWKQLRYYLPAPQHASKMRLPPQRAMEDENV